MPGRISMRSVVLSLAVAGVSAASAQTERTVQPRRIAVNEATAGEGIDQRVAQIVAEALLAEIRKHEQISAIGMNEIQDMLSFEAQRQLLGCGDEGCLAEIAGALGVDEMVTTNLSAVGDSHILKIARIDIVEAKVMDTYEERLAAASGEEFLAAIGPAVDKLFAEHPLRPGKTAGVSPALAAAINPPPLPPWVFWSTLGAAGAVGLTGGYFGLEQRNAMSRWDSESQKAELAAGDPTLPPADGAAMKQAEDDVRRFGGNANLAFGIAGGLAAVAVVEALFTDWKGARKAYRDEGPVASVDVVPGGVVVALW